MSLNWRKSNKPNMIVEDRMVHMEPISYPAFCILPDIWDVICYYGCSIHICEIIYSISWHQKITMHNVDVDYTLVILKLNFDQHICKGSARRWTKSQIFFAFCCSRKYTCSAPTDLEWNHHHFMKEKIPTSGYAHSSNAICAHHLTMHF